MSSPNLYSRQNLNHSSMNFVDKNGNLSREHQITHRNRYSEVQFTPLSPLHDQFASKIDDSGAISPPLWKNSSPSPPRSPSRPLLGHQSFSPDSRAQAIARGRSELMEMVRHMPESSYELSLKDIVEHHHRAENQTPKTGAAGLKKEESAKFERKPSFESKGLILNMAFPFSFRSKKKKKFVGNNSGRVSPKPDVLKVGGDRDWWKRKFTGSSDSDSSKTSNNSGASATTTTSSSSGGGRSRSDDHGRNKNGLGRGCWHFFHFRRSRSV